MRHFNHALVLAAVAVTLGCSGSTTSETGKSAGPAKSVDSTTVGSAADFDAILKKYVQGDNFDYAALKKSPEDVARFEAFLKWQAEADASQMTDPEQIAFYINAYNACCIKSILDHYPVGSPKEIKDFFKIKYTVAGEKLATEDIEYKRLIADHRDMRGHFAVVCADRGCLPLKAGAYRADTLDDDLNEAAKKFVADPRQFKVDPEQKTIEISMIFSPEWYGKKFFNDPQRAIDGGDAESGSGSEKYLHPWVNPQVKELLSAGGYKVKYIEWDWTLNEEGAKYQPPAP